MVEETNDGLGREYEIHEIQFVFVKGLKFQNFSNFKFQALDKDVYVKTLGYK